MQVAGETEKDQTSHEDFDWRNVVRYPSLRFVREFDKKSGDQPWRTLV